MICKIKKSQKQALIEHINKVAEGKPFIVCEKELSDDEIEVTIMASSFTPSQVEELENADLSSFQVIKKMEFEKTVSFEMPMKKRT